jgi:hypothetical protein
VCKSNFVKFLRLLSTCKFTECVVWSIRSHACLLRMIWCGDLLYLKTLVSNRNNLITKIHKILICFLNMFVSDTLDCVMLSKCKMLWLVYACIFTVCYYFSGDRIERGVYRRGEVFEYQEEEDQGQATQGKPSNLLHIWILFTCFAGCIKVYEFSCFRIAIALIAIILLAQAPQAYCYHPSRWPPWTPTLYPCSRGLLISSKVLGNPLVEPKTLRWEHSKDFLKMSSKTLE